MKMRKLFLLGLISCVLFGRHCLAMEGEDQRAVEVEDFDELPLADEEIERRRTAEAVNGLTVDLWGEIAGWAASPSGLVNMSLTNYPAQVGARRSAPVLVVEFPEFRAEQEKFVSCWVGFLDLAGDEEAEGEGLVSGTQAWNDCALWDRYPGMFVKKEPEECLSRFAAFSSTKPPNRVELAVDFDEWTNYEVDETLLSPQLCRRIHGLKLSAAGGTIRCVFPMLPILRSIKLNCKEENPFSLGDLLSTLKESTQLRRLQFSVSESLQDSQLNEFCTLENLDLISCGNVRGTCFEGTPRLKVLTVVNCQTDFSRLSDLPFLTVLRAERASELTDKNLEGLRLKTLWICMCPLVTGSCFESGTLRESLCNKLDITLCRNLDYSKIGNLTRLYSLELFFQSPDRDPSVSFEFLRNMSGLERFQCNSHEFDDESILAFTGSELEICMCREATGSSFSRMPRLEKVVLGKCQGIDEDLVSEEFDISKPHPSEVVLERKREERGERFK